MDNIKDLLTEYAERYETTDFLAADPSWFMHQVCGTRNQETLAFIASCLSYGSRKQFFPKIQYILDCSHGEVYDWVASARFDADIPCNASQCYYRLYTFATMNGFLHALKAMLGNYGTIGDYVRQNATDGLSPSVATSPQRA